MNDVEGDQEGFVEETEEEEEEEEEKEEKEVRSERKGSAHK